MRYKRIALILFELFFVITTAIMFWVFFTNITGMGASKIYADKISYWSTSLIPLGVSLLAAVATYYLHKKQRQLAKENE